MSGPVARRPALDGGWGPPQRLAGVHLLCGAGWLEASRRLWRDPLDAAAHRRRLFARVLGARHVGEGLALVFRPSARCMRLAAATDALHGASMVALAAIDPRWRDLALISAASACALSAYARGQAGHPLRDGPLSVPTHLPGASHYIRKIASRTPA